MFLFLSVCSFPTHYLDNSNYIKKGFWAKKNLSHFDIVPVIQIVGRKGTITKKEEHTSTQVQ